MRYLHNGKKVIAGVMSVFMLASSVNMPALQTVKADEITQENGEVNFGWNSVYTTDNKGNVTNNYKWKIDEEGNLVFAPTIEGTEAIIADNNADWYEVRKDEIKTLSFEGSVKVNNAKKMFEGTSNLVSVKLANAVFKGGMNRTFMNCYNLVEVDFAGADLTEVTSFGQLFYGDSSLKETFFEGAITAEDCALKSIGEMFVFCSSLVNPHLEDLDCSNVTGASLTFYYANSLKRLDLTSFNFDKLDGIGGMSSASHLFEIKAPKTNTTSKLVNFTDIKNSKSYGNWAVIDEDGSYVKFTDAQSIKDYNDSANEAVTYVFCPQINKSEVVDVVSLNEYTGYSQDEAMKLSITFNGKTAVEGVDYTVELVDTNSKEYQTLNVYATENGMFKSTSLIDRRRIKYKPATVTINATDAGYRYDGEPIEDPTYEIIDNVANEDPKGTTTITYYSDAECTNEIDKPSEKGMYWAKINFTSSNSHFSSDEAVICIRIDVPIIKSTWQAWDYDGTVHEYTGFNFWNPVNPKKRIYTDDYEIKLYSDPEYTQEVTEIKDAGTYYPVVTFFAQGDYAEITLPLHFVGVRRAKPTLVAEDQEYVYSAQKVSYTNYTVTGVLDAEGNPVDEGPTGNIDIRYFSDPECTESVSVPKNVGTYYVRIFVRVKGNYQESDKIVRTMVVKPYTPEVVVKDTYYRWDGTPKNARNGRDYTVIHAKNGCMSNPNVEVEYYQSVDGVMVKLDGAPTEVDMYYYRVRFLGDEPNYTETDWSDYKEFEIRKAYPVIEAENTYVDYDGEQHDLVYTVSLGDEGQQKRVLYYVDPEFTQLTSEVDGASYAGGAPSEPGTYYTKVIVSASTHYNWVSDKSAVLTIIDDYDYEISEPWNFYSFKGYTGYNDPWEPVRDYTDEIDEEELGQIEELAGYNLSELKVVYHRFAMPVFVTDPEDLLKPIEVVDEFDFPKTESGAPRIEGYYNAEVFIADENGEYRSLSDELHFTIGWTLYHIMY
ncbi:MAG: BspA family leucine-rich repeat surface protein [Lachnospiraceae bacterium]|nr:BspA family leucine-rich repeat surface protein [Lachnospiraceae bacterium]